MGHPIEDFEERFKFWSDENNGCRGPASFRGLNGQFMGILYNKTKDFESREISSAIRKDIKSELRNGKLPQGKYSVKLNRNNINYRTGIDIIADIPKTEWTLEEKESVEEKIKNITDKYNYDVGCLTSDGPGTYTERFYLNIDIPTFDMNYSDIIRKRDRRMFSF